MVEARWHKRDLEEHLRILDRKQKQYEESDLADKAEIIQGLSSERGHVLAKIHELPAYYTIRELKEQDEDTLVQDLMELLLWLDEQVSINNKMTQQQVVNCAYMVAEEFAGMCLEEIGIALKQGLNGHFGEIYRLDTNVILNWLRKYHKEKAELIREMNESQHASSKEDSTAERNGGPVQPDKIDPASYFR